MKFDFEKAWNMFLWYLLGFFTLPSIWAVLKTFEWLTSGWR